MDILGIAQQGLQKAQGQFDKAAQQVVNTGLNSGLSSAGSQSPVDSVSLSDAAVSMMSSKTQFESDLGVAHTGKEMEKATMSLLQ
jgi:hypothetical protein